MKRKTGAIASNSIAEMSHHKAALPCVNPATRVGKVFALLNVRVIANRSSFHEKMEVKAAVAASPGNEIGKIIRRSAWK